tara:strand:+ start:907 stop:1086 length:180 start_codon:yes stop_codon:yes gene_type:complete
MEVVMGIVTVITTVKTLYNTSKDVKRYVEKKNNKLKTPSMEPWLLVEEDEDLVIVEVSS